MAFVYGVDVKPLGGGSWAVTSRDFPEISVTGRHPTELLGAASTALADLVIARLRAGQSVPESNGLLTGHEVISLSTRLSAKAALHAALRHDGLKPAALALRMRISEHEARLLLDPTVPSNIDDLDRALAALDRQPVLHVVAKAQIAYQARRSRPLRGPIR